MRGPDGAMECSSCLEIFLVPRTEVRADELLGRYLSLSGDRSTAPSGAVFSGSTPVELFAVLCSICWLPCCRGCSSAHGSPANTHLACEAAGRPFGDGIWN